MQSNSRFTMRQACYGSLLGLAISAAAPAHAEDAAPDYTLIEAINAGKNMSNLRLRYEHVDQDNRSEHANALTLRTLVGWQTADFHKFSLGVQLINVAKLVDDYNDMDLGASQPGMANYPAIVDPDATDINQLYLDWKGIKDTSIRLGRQSVKLDNVRFIGNIEFRQLMQVFDGVAIENKSLPNTSLYFAHFERVKQINNRKRSGNLDIAHATYSISPGETVTAYGYFNNFNDLGFNANNGLGLDADASNKTLGLRLDGARKLGDPWKLLYTAEYAKQTDYSGGDSRIDAHYAHFGAGAMVQTWYLRLDQERLSSNDGVYAFQTPFGTNRLFQGWADQFLVTPVWGMRDSYLSFGGKPLPQLSLVGEFHVFRADEDFTAFNGGTSNRYGNEIDLAATWSFNQKLSLKVEYANFREGDRIAQAAARKADLERFWITALYNF
ncbi:alginate export family protein [Methylobacillus arboreus]|uniref:alginate export family protein n=1 Tax=Methylobacillus arboreus TaxID=755170 RepID=UPI001E61C9A8|nr:alginate export family protein [Methylobacillus arboreus]MCB5191100.1 alginate export family protein [Methylobacillus arboreus]